MIWRISYQGLMVTAITLTAFIIGRNQGGEALGQTMAFASLVMAKLVHAGNLHSNTESRFRFNILNNKPLIFALLMSLVLTLAVLLIGPLMTAFEFTHMTLCQWGVIVLLAFGSSGCCGDIQGSQVERTIAVSGLRGSTGCFWRLRPGR